MAITKLDIDVVDVLHMLGSRESRVDGEKNIQLIWGFPDGRSTTQTFKHTGKTTFSLSSPPANTIRLQIDVTHPDYVPQQVSVRGINQRAIEWNNPACHADTQGTSLRLRITLSRIRQASGAAWPPDGQPKGDPGGVFVDNDPKTRPFYHELRTLLKPVATLNMLDDHPTSAGPGAVTVLQDPDAIKNDEWKRFYIKGESNVDIWKGGGFLWLEYGSLTSQRRNEPRFLIAVWAPALLKPVPKDGIDYLVFYSPSTAIPDFPASAYPYRQNYPYIVNSKTNQQPYIILGYRYLFGGHLLVAQAIASNKPPVVIMPIFPHEEQRDERWKPFDTQAGVYRLILEVALFLQQIGYSGAQSGFEKWYGRTAVIGGVPSPEFPPAAFSSQPGIIPSVRNVTIAGYSSSSKAINRLLINESLNSPRYPSEFFGADSAEFKDRWRELWALDLHLGRDTKIPREQIEKRLYNFLTEGRDRRLRVHQSGWTHRDISPNSFYPIWSKVPRLKPTERREMKTDQNVWAEEWRDTAGRWSFLFTSSNYLRSSAGNATIAPVFPRPSDHPGIIHPFCLILGFGHASKLRSDR